MKKLLSLTLAILMIVSCFIFAVGAVSEKAGIAALNAQFVKREGIMDYVYYSPVKGDNDDTKYPVVVWLHGNSSGDYPGHQLENCDIGRWSSEEYQSRFEGTGGAFLFLPRYPTNSVSIAWEGPTTTLKSSIDSFLKIHEANIDTNRIYIGGYSMGGKMVLRMASTYPELFAAAFPLSPVYAPTTAELNSLVDMPIWFAWCKNDTYVSLNQVTVKGNWNYLMNISNCKEDCRLVTFDKIYRSNYALRTADDAGDTHNTWDAATHDFFMDDGAHFKDVTITDGNGEEISLTYPNGLISWLSSQSLAEDDGNSTRGSIIIKLLSKIGEFFSDFFVALMNILTGAL
ncbi:MAG: prolyl oligopeptidase family serine peptidase [Clostridia bacterium]|nr:prolyl oligopeptidase family serine peptidase [Clostridia bacterium]